LAEEERDELGGVEYRALKTLLWVLLGTVVVVWKLTLVYYFSVLLLSCLCLGLWILRDSDHSSILDNDGINRGWWAFFTTSSMFSNVGMTVVKACLMTGYTLTPDAMISFQQAVFPLLVLAFVIIAGYKFILISIMTDM
jgi:Trk-type K+ transport system membrane component